MTPEDADELAAEVVAEVRVARRNAPRDLERGA